MELQFVVACYDSASVSFPACSDGTSLPSRGGRFMFLIDAFCYIALKYLSPKVVYRSGDPH